MDYIEAMTITKTELYNKIKELEAENQKLREQRDAANARIQLLNSIIAGDIE